MWDGATGRLVLKPARRRQSRAAASVCLFHESPHTAVTNRCARAVVAVRVRVDCSMGPRRGGISLPALVAPLSAAAVGVRGRRRAGCKALTCTGGCAYRSPQRIRRRASACAG